MTEMLLDGLRHLLTLLFASGCPQHFWMSRRLERTL